jgi:hypothetical protein
MNATARLAIVPLGLSLGSFLVITYVLCVLVRHPRVRARHASVADPIAPRFHLDHLAELLPRFALELRLRLVRRCGLRAAVQFFRRPHAMKSGSIYPNARAGETYERSSPHS